MKFNLIVAACENSGIGMNGRLPWNLKNELKYFNRMTNLKSDLNKQNALIMGRKTYFGIPEKYRPLPNRINIVLTRNTDRTEFPNDVIVCSSLENAIECFNEPYLKDLVENVWIVGGNSVYKEAMDSPYCHRVYLTKIKAVFDCDTFFPPIPEEFKITEDENVPKEIQEENGIQYEFIIYENPKH